MVANPPYGVRFGETDRLRNLYAQFGKVLSAKFAGWRVALVSADPSLERQTRLRLQSVLRTSNGGIKSSDGGGSPSATRRFALAHRRNGHSGGSAVSILKIG